MSKDGYNSILVASPGQSEGKTFTAVNLAVSLAREKTRTVLLIDTDLRRPAVVHSYFGLSQDFLNTPAMHSFVREVKGRYPDRYIIFDSPPLLGFSDALYLSRFADGIIIIVRCQETKEEDLKRSLELLRDRHILGTVLNKVRSEFAEWRGYEKYYQ